MKNKKEGNKKSVNQIKDESIEDTTMYPEFIPTFDNWLTSELQKRNAKHLQEIAEMTSPKDIKHKSE